MYWETGAVADSITIGHPYVFRTVATGSTLGRAAVDFTGTVLLPGMGVAPGSARAVIANVNDVYGRSVAGGEVEQAARYGISVTDRIEYDPRAFDPAAVADRIAADRADFFWDVSYIDDGVALWKAIVDRRVPLRAAVGTSSAFCMEDFAKRLGQDAVGVYAADKPDENAIDPRVLLPEARSLLGGARKAYGKPMTIPAVAGFVGGWALFHGVLPRIDGPVTADAIRSAAHELDEPPLSSVNGGGVRFGRPGTPDEGQNLLAPSLVGQWQPGPTMRVVFPRTFAQAEPILQRQR